MIEFLLTLSVMLNIILGARLLALAAQRMRDSRFVGECGEGPGVLEDEPWQRGERPYGDPG
jgi:hypothetical protein